MLNSFLILSFVGLFFALFIAAIRLFKGPSAIDRVIIFDLFSSIAIGAMAIAYLWLGDTVLLDVGLLLSVVAFIGTIGFARYIERGHSE